MSFLNWTYQTGMLRFSNPFWGLLSSYLEDSKTSKLATLIDKKKCLPTTQLYQTTADDVQLSTVISLSILSLLLLQSTMTPCRMGTRSVPRGSTLSKVMMLLWRRRPASSREVFYDSALDWLIAILVIQRATHAS